jgi:hypothetical protein
VVEWSITTDCKSVGFGLRRFESCPAHMEGESKYIPKEFSEEAKTFKQRMNRLNISGDIQKSIELFDEAAIKMQELLQKYSDEEIRKTELFHVVSGSTPMEGPELSLDLPEGEFAAFISELENKYGSV